MTQFISLNAAALPDVLPTSPLAVGAPDGQQSLILSYSWANNPGFIGVRANGTAVNPLPPKRDDTLAVFGSGGYVGSGQYDISSGAVVLLADEDWSPVGTGSYISLNARTKGKGTLAALSRMHVTADGVTINDANGNEPTGGRLGAGTLNVAGGVAIGGASILAGPTAFTPADASGAGLAAFTGVSVNWYRVGNMIFVYGSLTYPATGSGLVAAITLPVAVPNVGYANPPGAVISNGGPAGLILQANQNTSTATFRVTPGGGVTNAALTLATLSFMLVYPAS